MSAVSAPLPLYADASALYEEARRQLTVCNSCRYCEGYCETFLALERRPTLADGDIRLIANICHDCRGCFQACMYTPPHEFAIEIPALLSSVRADTNRRYAWPRSLAGLFTRPAVSTLLGALGGLAFVTIAALGTGDASRLARADAAPGSFYRVVPFEVLLWSILALVAFAAAAWFVTGRAFARDARIARPASLADLWATARDALTLRGMSGGGEGCYFPAAERRTDRRRVLHVLVVGGFILANVSTALAAAFQHLLGMPPPYPVISAPVLFGIAGGIATIVGTTGLLALKARASGRLISREMLRTDWTFLIVFDLVSITGMLTLILRETPFMSAMFLLHLATLAALFVTVPYGKFTHVLYRLLALFQHERDLREESASV
jgi:citrate/tricarballylate utilization protein